LFIIFKYFLKSIFYIFLVTIIFGRVLYKTIVDKFLEQRKLSAFKKAHDKLLEIRTLYNIKKSPISGLFVDSTNINNKNCSQLTNFGQKKKIT
jgi:hypothetical protein